MPLYITAAEADDRRRHIQVNGREYTLAEYVGAAPSRGIYVDGNEASDKGLPQGFLVMQPPNAITPAHFHEPNQFQVFVEGDARLGARKATPLTIQYANGHTPYGPIVAGDAGINYFTLRQRWDPGAKYLPASMEKLVKGRQRTRVKSFEAGATIAASAEPSVETVFAPEDDGLAAWRYRLPAGGACTLPDPAEGGGQYIVVTEGALRLGGETLPRHSLAFLMPDDAALEARSEGGAVAFLVLQFPRLKPATA